MKMDKVKVSDARLTTGIQRLGQGKYRFSVRKGSYAQMKTKQQTVRCVSEDEARAKYIKWYDDKVEQIRQSQALESGKAPRLSTFVKTDGKFDRFGRTEVKMYAGTTAHKRVKSVASWVRVMSSLRMVQSGRRLEALGRKRLDEITFIDVQEALTSLQRDLANTTIRNFQNNLSKVFRLAIERKVLPKDFKNPVEGTVIGEITPPEETISGVYDYEYEGILDEIRKMDVRHRLFYMLSLTSGMRRGEIGALQFEDIDLNRNSIRIIHSMTEYTGVGHTELGIKNGTKNGKTRTTILPTVLRPVLEEYLQTVKPIPWKDSEGRTWHLLFMNPKTSLPYTLSSFTQHWDRTRDKWLEQGILNRKVTLHGLRKSFITYLGNGKHVPDDIIAKIVGHSNPMITHRIYIKTGHRDIENVDINL